MPKYSTLSRGGRRIFQPKFTEVAESPAASVDLSYFSQDGIPPGTYHLDVYINDKYVSSDSLTFQEISHDAGATASPACPRVSEFMVD